MQIILESADYSSPALPQAAQCLAAHGLEVALTRTGSLALDWQSFMATSTLPTEAKVPALAEILAETIRLSEVTIKVNGTVCAHANQPEFQTLLASALAAPPEGEERPLTHADLDGMIRQGQTLDALLDYLAAYEG